MFLFYFKSKLVVKFGMIFFYYLIVKVRKCCLNSESIVDSELVCECEIKHVNIRLKSW